MSSAELILLALCSVGAFISGVTGFGMVLIYFAILGFTHPSLDLRLMLPPLVVAAVVKNGYSVRLYWDNIDWGIVKRIAIWGVPCALIGGYFSSRVGAETIKQVLGGIILLYVITQVSPKKTHGILPLWAQRIWAAGWGFIHGLVLASGPILVALLQQIGLTKERFVGALQALFLILNIPAMFLYVSTIETPYLSPAFVLGVSVLGTTMAWLGKRILPYIPLHIFRYSILTLLLASGLKFLL